MSSNSCVLPSLRHYVELVVCSVTVCISIAPRSPLELCMHTAVVTTGPLLLSSRE